MLSSHTLQSEGRPIVCSREASVENLLDERAHLSWARVMPNSGRQLGRGCVSQVEVIEEDNHVQCLHGFAYVGVAPFC